MLDLLRELCALPGVSGCEGPVREAIIEKIKDNCQYSVDALGNILAFKKGAQVPPKKILFSAHMDEVGFIITNIEENGFLRFAPVGGIDSRVAVGKGIFVGEQQLFGIIGTKAVHQQTAEEKKAALKFDKLLIDIGCSSREEAEKLVQPGDRAVFQSDFLPFGDGKLKAKALDDRAGCALLIKMIGAPLPYDCHFAFTVNEETGMMGAGPAAYTIGPDIAIAVEATTAGDIADVPGHKQVCKLGGGPVLSFMDKRTLYNKKLYKIALDVAVREDIPCQPKAGVYGGNEAGALQTVRGGSAVLAVSLPCRYIHSPSCMIQLSDLDHTYTLLCKLLTEVTAHDL